MIKALKELPPCSSTEYQLLISEFYTAYPAKIPITIIRGRTETPVFFVTAAVHGDELNGVEIVRRIIQSAEPEKMNGTLICVPIVNRFGFLERSRYVSDRRDLNRYFPGNSTGCQASRIASRVFKNIVKISKFGMDIHTAAYGKENVPHIRVDISNPAAKEMAEATGTDIIVCHKGSIKSLRRASCKAGIPCILLEAGETLKFQLDIISQGVDMVKNVMAHLGMLEYKPARNPLQAVIRKTRWIRADKGGILVHRLKPGDRISKNTVLADVTDPFGTSRNEIVSHVNGVILGIATLPLVHPGDAVFHVGEM